LDSPAERGGDGALECPARAKAVSCYACHRIPKGGRAVREKLLELASEDPGIAACNQAVLDGALLLDRLEN
jgi:hypothetical protein